MGGVIGGLDYLGRAVGAQIHSQTRRRWGTSFVRSVFFGRPDYFLFGKIKPSYGIDPPTDAYAALRDSYRESARKIAEKRFSGAEMEFALAVTEPDVESDLASLQTRFHDGKLSGKKCLVTNGLSAKKIIVAANETIGDESVLSLWVVDSEAPGVTKDRCGRPELEMANISFENVSIEEADRIGAPGEGYSQLKVGTDLLRRRVAELATGLAKEELARAVGFVEGGVQFRKPLIDLSVVKERLAAVEEGIFLLETTLAICTSLEQEDFEATAEIALTRILAAELLEDACASCSILSGGAFAASPLTPARELAPVLHHAGGSDDVLRSYVALFGGRPLLQFLVDTEKGKKRPGTWFDAVTKRKSMEWKLRLHQVKPPRVSKELKGPVSTFTEMVGILAERSYQVFDYYGNDAYLHTYELARLAEMAKESFALWCLIHRAHSSDDPQAKEEAARFGRYRAVRAWPRVARVSRELYLSDEADVTKIARELVGLPTDSPDRENPEKE